MLNKINTVTSLILNSRYNLRKRRKILIIGNWSEEKFAFLAGNMLGESGCVTLFRSFKLELTEPSIYLKNITKFYPQNIRIYQELFEVACFFFLRRARNYDALYHKLNNVNEKIKINNLNKLASYDYEKVIVYLDKNEYAAFAEYFYPILSSNSGIKEIIVISDKDFKGFLKDYVDLNLDIAYELPDKLKIVEPPLLYESDKYDLCYSDSGTVTYRDYTLLASNPSSTTEMIIQNLGSKIDIIMVSDQDISSLPSNFRTITIKDWEEDRCSIFMNTQFVLIDTESLTFTFEILVHALAHGAKPITIVKNVDLNMYSGFFYAIESGNFKMESTLEKAVLFYQNFPIDYEDVKSNFYSVNRLNSIQTELESLA
jgi:hypothetical protein